MEAATAKFIQILQQAEEVATPNQHSFVQPKNILFAIKRLVALKRKSRATWQRTHAPSDRRNYNNASHKLKAALHKLRNDNFTE